ncbi:MAG: threonine synthase [Ruminococcaceae bacterium]|nr:threonine synthase [Oscillospiraceae bacterium]
MFYQSTRGENDNLTAAQVIKKGIASDGGLYMPCEIPKIDIDFISSLCPLDYTQRAEKVLGLFLDDYNNLGDICKKAYSRESFGEHPAPVVSAGELNFLELWHGPTCAFKDMALQFMPLALSEALKMTESREDACILVATSGDTGKAALEGYKNLDKIKIMVFYPCDGVSKIQKLQMASQEGDNVNVCAIRGNFDDAQSGVKKIFADKDFAQKAHEAGYFLSSANSINWGRLAPQIVYYISAYCDMVNSGKIKLGDAINVCVPTGNFGNIFAGYIAYMMGLNINKFVCASNKNNILTDFMNTGVYDRNRPFYQTSSPSMDILISSNLERLLYLVSGCEETSSDMKQLNEKGVYKVTDETRAKIEKMFCGYYCDEDNTKAAIKKYFDQNGYLMDTHTAVAAYCAEKYRENFCDNTPMLVVSTASPYKFAADVLASFGKTAEGDEFSAISALEAYTGAQVPAPIAALMGKKPRFTTIVDKQEMSDEVIKFLK